MSNLRPRLRHPASTGLARRVGRITGSTDTGSTPAPAKIFLKPRWLGVHLFIVVITVAMVLLGRWQLRVSNTKHFDLQNFGYALQWWAFSAFAVLLWLRIIRDARRPPPPPAEHRPVIRTSQGDHVADGTYSGPADLITRTDQSAQRGRRREVAQTGEAPVIYRGYVMANSATNPARSDGDRYHAAYNDYLWQLGLADSTGRSRTSTAGGPDTPAIAPEPLDAPAIEPHSSLPGDTDQPRR